MEDNNVSGRKLTSKSKKGTSLSYNSWPYIPNEKLLNAWLLSKKKAKGSVTQTTMDTMGKQLHIAVMNGWTVEDCLEKAENSGWRGFEGEWMGIKKNEKASIQSAFDRLTDVSWAEGISRPN